MSFNWHPLSGHLKRSREALIQGAIAVSLWHAITVQLMLRLNRLSNFLVVAFVCVWIECYQRASQMLNGARGAGVLLCVWLHETGGGGGRCILQCAIKLQSFSLVQSLLPEFSAVSARGGGAFWWRSHKCSGRWVRNKTVSQQFIERAREH